MVLKISEEIPAFEEDAVQEDAVQEDESNEASDEILERCIESADPLPIVHSDGSVYFQNEVPHQKRPRYDH